MNESAVSGLIDLALAEDLGTEGDLTSRTFVDPEHTSRGRLAFREDAVVAGLTVAQEVFRRVEPSLVWTGYVNEGDRVGAGSVAAEVEGPTSAILTAERTALNFLQRLSGVATVTRTYVDAVRGLPVAILDTRKTTPGWRLLEKAAVASGGGQNHRMGLFDAVMVKDNHLVANKSPVDIEQRIRTLRQERPGLTIEVEADTLEQVETFLSLEGIDIVLLDNMDCGQLRKAVQQRDEMARSVRLEASGGITLESVRSIAETGVDRISVGALTHSVRSIDIGLDLLATT